MQVRAADTRGRLVPALATAAVAVLATAALVILEFNPPRNVLKGEPGMITSAAANRAGATVLPTDPVTTGSVRYR
ncbi:MULTISPECIES: hypothetical protein [Bradyrhizobium]|uniref:Uncharacterized protein n=1 Tax=Bradyrhizobium macuxiense TaxID=1755647 RepID=A0A560M0V9_9BRAD|nr:MULTISPECIES: hypothetical protein [Bradyrhizobium]MDH2385692.1 hypothetical protein [Bradyrhizobium sp. CER78]TWC01309.1 hypothetical protein FBZ93_104588 [Bradyrhizobium macuxiense]